MDIQQTFQPVDEAVGAFKNVLNYEDNLDRARGRLKGIVAGLTDAEFAAYVARTEKIASGHKEAN